MSVLRSPLINPLRSPLYSPLLSSVAWWGNYNPSTGFAYDFKLNRYMSQGKSTGITQVVTEGRSTDAYVLDGGGNYILRYGPRTNLCLNKDFTALSADINTTVTHMPLEPGMDGSLGNVYRIQFPATTDTKLVLANVTSASPHTVSLNAKKFDPSNTQFGLFTTGGSPDTANFVATDDWVRVAFFPTSVSGDIFLLNVGDAYITDILVEKPQVELGDTATPYIETTGTAVTVPAEPAQANGHGLDGFDVSVNLFLNPTLQGLTSWIAGGDGPWDITANAGLDPTGAQVASVLENQNSFNFGSFLYQGVAIVNTEMTISLWAYADEEVAADLRLNDNENTLNITIGTEMQRFDHTGTIGPALLGGTGRCGFANREDWAGKGVVIAWVQITVGGPAPFSIGTRDADDTRVAQGDDGGSPTIAPGFTANPDELTFRVDWDGVAVGTGAFRYLFEVKNSSNKRVAFIIRGDNNNLVFGGDQTGSFQNITAGTGPDDGGPHTAVCYVNRTTNEFKMSVDGATTISGTLTGAVPSNLDEMAINRRATGGPENANGTNCRIQVSEGDFYDAFRDSSAGFF